MDIVFSVLALAALLPIFLLAAFAISLESGWPVLFKQTRVGMQAREFGMYKFRSMVNGAQTAGPYFTNVNDTRITRVGRFIRKVRIDELPQLWTVLKGEMSFVGPRPERPQFVAELGKKIPFYAERHVVKPGITGWAQIHGHRGETDTIDKMQARVEYDLEYLRNWSLGLDLQIIARTIKLVFFDSHAY